MLCLLVVKGNKLLQHQVPELSLVQRNEHKVCIHRRYFHVDAIQPLLKVSEVYPHFVLMVEESECPRQRWKFRLDSYWDQLLELEIPFQRDFISIIEPLINIWAFPSGKYFFPGILFNDNLFSLKDMLHALRQIFVLFNNRWQV